MNNLNLKIYWKYLKYYIDLIPRLNQIISTWMKKAFFLFGHRKYFLLIFINWTIMSTVHSIFEFKVVKKQETKKRVIDVI